MKRFSIFILLALLFGCANSRVEQRISNLERHQRHQDSIINEILTQDFQAWEMKSLIESEWLVEDCEKLRDDGLDRINHPWKYWWKSCLCGNDRG